MTFTLAKQTDFMGTDTMQIPAAAEVVLEDLPISIRRVVDTAMRGGIPYSLRRLPAEAIDPETIAAACGTEPEAIVRCLVYRAKTSRKAMLILSSAKTNVSERALSQVVGEVLEKADAAMTEKITGFAPAGLPPFSLATRLPIVMDEALVGLGRIWCMAGSPELIMSVPTMLLRRAIAARIAKIDSSSSS